MWPGGVRAARFSNTWKNFSLPKNKVHVCLGSYRKINFFNLLVAPTARGPSKSFSPCRKTPACKLWAHLVPGEPSFWYFYVGGPGVSPEVWTFSGSTLKRLKWFFEAAFEPRDYQNIDLHVMEHHLDRLLYGFVHYESSFDHANMARSKVVLKSIV